MTDDPRPTALLPKVRPRWRAILDRGRRTERILKYYLRRRPDNLEYEPTYRMIAERYPGIPTRDDVAQLLSQLRPRSAPQQPAKIFQYWHQGRTPQLAAQRGLAPWHPVHIMSARSYACYAPQGHVVLDFDSLHDYLNVPDALLEALAKAGRYPMLADVVRCMLLLVHGGIWSDLTVMALGPIPEYVYQNDFFVYTRGQKPADYLAYRYFDWGTYSWDPQHHVRITNGFIHCTPENFLMGQLLCKFLEIIRGELHDLGALHYYIFMIAYDYLVRNAKEFGENFAAISRYPSDALLHYVVVHCAQPYSTRLHQMIKNELPIQRIKLSTRFFKGCLAYEILRHEGW